jgi:hypothetical protein
MDGLPDQRIKLVRAGCSAKRMVTPARLKVIGRVAKDFNG